MRLQLVAAALLACLLAAVTARTAHADAPWRIAMDTLLYVDTDNVSVVSPQLAVHRELDEEGGTIGARVVVDALSAASVDVVSQATARFEEVRTEVDLKAAKRVRQVLASVSYRLSQEPDYTSHGVRVGAERRVKGADTTVATGYGFTRDRVGMTGTPRSVFSERLSTHAADVGVTQVLGRNTLARLVYTLTVQRGYMEKPYRFVPLFDEAGLAAAAADGVVLDLASFDRYRLASKPREEVPDTRVRQSVSLRALRYVPSLGAALRVDYQFYLDSWGLRAHILEPAVRKELPRSLQLDAYARLYLQSGASFWRRTYVVSDMTVPTWRTADRSLSPFRTVTGNLRLKRRGTHLTAYVEATVMYTQFRDYMYLTDRTALIAQLGMRWIP